MAHGIKVKTRFSVPIPSKNTVLFLTVWVAGAILGTVCATAASNSYFLLMRIAPGSTVSIVGLAVTILLPFLLTAFAVYSGRPGLSYPVCFMKVFAFGFCGYGISAAYGSAGWLIRTLFQFSDILTIPVLCLFALRHHTGRRMRWKRDFGIGLCIDVLVCCLDLWFISPFLATIT